MNTRWRATKLAGNSLRHTVEARIAFPCSDEPRNPALVAGGTVTQSKTIDPERFRASLPLTSDAVNVDPMAFRTQRWP